MSESTQAPRIEDRSISSSVEVAVDPDTAFSAFTEELDLWWVRGPINHHAAGRLLAMRCEPGVGGRLLEVYDDSTGEALELARITEWDPGKGLSWRSSIDDVETEVRFEPTDSGTAVTVVARIPEAGQDRGGTMWVRVVPSWFPAWCATRDRRAHEVRDLARLALGVYYRKPVAAARWLVQAFGFDPTSPLPEDPDPQAESGQDHLWIEFRLGDSSLMLFKREGDGDGDGDGQGVGAVTVPTHVPWVYVDHIEEHYLRSTGNGATVVSELDSPWGLPFYVVDDCEGQRWTFAQARPTMH